MMDIAALLPTLIVGYLLGSVPFGLILTRITGNAIIVAAMLAVWWLLAAAVCTRPVWPSMRIVSSMVRPQVVHFLDEMLRSDNKLRVEEVHVPAGRAEQPLSALGPASRSKPSPCCRSRARRRVFRPSAFSASRADRRHS